MDAQRLELLGQVAPRLGHVALALLALLVDQPLDLLVLARVQRGEREVLELPLDRVDAEAVREGRVDVQRLLRLVDLLLLAQAGERAHVVQAVGELDEDDPDVRGHRDHHLAVVLRLRLVARLEDDAGELGDPVDEAGHLVAELAAHLLEGGAGVLHRVVEQGGAQRLGVEAHAGADLRHAHRVGDEVLTRLAPLVGVVLAGEDEGALDLVAIDLETGVVRVLLDDREEVAEQAALQRREIGALDGPDAVGVLGAAHGATVRSRARRRLDCRLPVARRTPVAVRSDRFGQAAWAVVSVRYRSPSWWRWA